MNEYKPDILQVRDPVTGEFVPIAAIKGDKGDIGPEGKQGPKGDPGEVTQAVFDREIASLSEQIVQSDWNENDPQSKAFVKNRPFYEGVSEEVIFREQSLTFVDGFNETPMPKFAVGDTIKVIWDGTTYIREAKEIIPVEAPYPYVGNLAIVDAGVDTGEPFILGELEGEEFYFCLSRVDGTFPISLSKVSKSVVKIPEKYLPDIPTPPDPLPPITPELDTAFLQAVDGQPTWVKLIDRSKVGG